jgi:hypothetical protein
MRLRHLAESELGVDRKVGGNFSCSWHADSRIAHTTSSEGTLTKNQRRFEMKLKNACIALSLLFCASMAYSQVTGSGTENTVPLWLGTKSLGNSGIFQSGGNVGIGTAKPNAK